MGVHAAEDTHVLRTAVPASRLLVVALVLVNGLLLAGNLLVIRARETGRRDGLFTGRRWFGQLDGSYSELFGHVALLAAAVLLAVVWQERRTAVHLVWAVVLGLLVADDFLQVHERLGGVLVRALGLPAVAGLRPQDLGELLVWAAPAPLLGAALLLAHVRARGTARRHSWTLITLMAALAGFAVVVDMAAHPLHHLLAGRANTAMILIENVGEVGVMSLFLIAAHHMTRTATTAPPRHRGRHRRQPWPPGCPPRSRWHTERPGSGRRSRSCSGSSRGRTPP